MKLAVCTIFDLQSKAYSNPFYTPNVATGQREFKRLILDPTSSLYAFPEDYKLFELGTFDPDTGTFDLLAVPNNITV